MNDPNDTARKIAEHVAAILALVAQQAPAAPRYVHVGDADFAAATGETVRAFEDACRAGEIHGAVRTTLHGWGAPVDAIRAWQAAKGNRPRKLAAVPPPAETPAEDPDVVRLRAVGGAPTRRAR